MQQMAGRDIVKSNRLKALVLSLVSRSPLFAHYALRRDGYLSQLGWFESWRQKVPVDRTGAPLPWITYPCIAFLERRVRPDMAVFEYGCGNSTLWWARRVRRVVSCEHDPTWCERVRQSLPHNTELHWRDLSRPGWYAGMIDHYAGEFDIVFVDGRDRVNCIKHSVAALRAGGVVILDNSDLAEYQEGVRFLLQHDFRQLEFGGMGPVTIHAFCTSIFYRTGNCLGI
jgi:hypothetical protein